MKRLYVLLVILLVASSAMAQQDPLYAQYLNNPLVLNPAYTGLTNNLTASVSYRKQWVGFEGSPVTMNASGHLSLSNNTMGVGLMLISDQIGATAVTEIFGSYAYRIKVSGNKLLAFGLQAGLLNYKIRNPELLLQDPNDPAFTGETNERKPEIGSGLIFAGDQFFIGLSVPRMLAVSTKADAYNTSIYTRHYYAMAAYLFLVSERVSFKPAVLAKIVESAPASVDINAGFILDTKYTAALLTRNFSTYGMLLQGKFNAFTIGYVFEVPTSKSVGTAYPTHEITLGLRANVLKAHTHSRPFYF